MHKLIVMAEAILMTIISYFMMIKWQNAITVIPVILSTLFWVKKIKHTQIIPHYNGSWIAWFKSFFNSKKNKDEG